MNKNATICFLLAAYSVLGCHTQPIIQEKRKPQLYTSVQAETSTDKPLIIEWSSADRGSLEARMQEGTVAIRIVNDEIRVLDDCVVPGQYGYRGFTRKLEAQVLSTDKELDANFSFGSAKLGGALRKFGKLYVSMSLVGRWETNLENHSPNLKGKACEGATHIINAASTGAFRFYSGQGKNTTGGAQVSTFHSGAAWKESSEFQTEDGNFDACEVSKTGDTCSPEGCSALVRLELRALGLPTKKEEKPVFDFGDLEFFNADNGRLTGKRGKTPVGYKNGPFPQDLCKDLQEIKMQVSLKPLYEYCRINQTHMATVMLEGKAVKKRGDAWYLSELPGDNPFDSTLKNYDSIVAVIRSFPKPKQRTISRLAQNIIAVLHWRTKNLEEGDDKILKAASQILSPLKYQVSNSIIKTDEQWWAAHLLTVSGIDDRTAQLAKVWPFRFATGWHIHKATDARPREVAEILPQIMDKLDECDPFRVEALILMYKLHYAAQDWDSTLKTEIEIARVSQKLGDWAAPGSGVYYEAKFQGLTSEAELYINEDPWVLADFLWDKTTDCFVHEDYLCVRQNLYRILDETPNTPVVPIAYDALIELEYAMGNRAKAFKLKMDQPSWTVNSLWAGQMRQAAPCLDDNSFRDFVGNAKSLNAEEEMMSRKDYVLVGRNLQNWNALLSIGSTLRECLTLTESNEKSWVNILRDPKEGTLEIEASASIASAMECIEYKLDNEWQDSEFGLAVRVNISAEAPWYMDWSTGWSKIDQFKLSCDAGEIEGCYQLGVVYASDPEKSSDSLSKAKSYFKKSCTEGHAEACNWLPGT